MKILIMSTSVVPLGGNRYGGIEKLCYDFVDQLNKIGHKVSVAAPIGSIVPKGVELIETVKLPEEQDRDDLAVLRVFAQTKEWDWEVVHDFSHGHKYARLSKNQGAVISMLWDPVVHAYPKAPYNIVCLSNWQKERFEKKYNQKAIVMPMMVNTDRYKPDPDAKRERFLFLGKISPEKGVHKAIEYARELKVPLDVVGGLIPSEQDSQYLKMITIMIDRARYQENLDIQFHWNVTEDEKIKFLQNAKAVIYPVQQDEAHWLVGVETWVCGTPTIALERGSMRELQKHSSGIHWIAVEDGDFKHTMMLSGLDDPHRKWGWDISDIIRTYGHENVISQWEKLYQEVASGKRW